MKYFPLVFASLFRKKTRFVLTLMSIIVAFFLFGMLQAVNEAFNAGAEGAKENRMITNSRWSIIEMLPVNFKQQIESVPGVEAVAHASWFGGSMNDQQLQFAVFPVVPADYLDLAPEIGVTPEVREKWINTRTGAIVGASLAKRLGWKVGQKVAIKADIWPKAGGDLNWEFDLVGTYVATNGDPNGESALLFQYDYFDEARQYGKGSVGWYLVRIKDADQADTVAKSIDRLFANSQHETKTQSEKAFAQGFAKQFGDIGFIITAILGAVFFTILVLTGNTMAQSLRERIPELGILKTLGFGNQTVWWLVLAEGVLLSVIGAVLGLLLSGFAIGGLKAALSGIGVSNLSGAVFAKGMAIAVLLGVAVALLPALRAMRIKIIDALNS